MDNTKKYTEAWEKVYQTTNPFDLDAPYEWIVELENSGRIKGRVLDSGCGAGHNSIYLAGKLAVLLIFIVFSLARMR